MSDAATAGAIGGILAGGIVITLLLVLFSWVLYIIAYWKVFNKMGEPGWKCIIPIYNQYILFKGTWKASMFWVYLVVALLAGIFVSMGATVDVNGEAQQVSNPLFAMLGMALMTAALVIEVMQLYYMSKSFGHGAGYTLGLLFLTFIFALILGFGSSRYIGPMGRPRMFGQPPANNGFPPPQMPPL